MRRLVRFLPWIALAGTVYVAAVAVVSLTSDERVLGLDQTKRFCGPYLDCHLGVAVARVDTTSRIGDRVARGVFHVVTLRYSSDARRATLRLSGVAAAVRDADGRWYRRDAEAEATLTRDGELVGRMEARIEPGDTIQARIVFDLPPDARRPLLWVHDASLPARLTEFLLPGDEDSFLHRRTFFALSRDAPTVRIGDFAVSVLDVERDTAAGSPHPVPADGVFYLVTLALKGRAEWDARLVDDAGTAHPRAHDVERLLPDAPRTRTMVFDVPDRTSAPVLEIRRHGLLGRTVRIPLT